MKYAKKYDSGANYITTKFPFRITKSSKYISGVEKILQAVSWFSKMSEWGKQNVKNSAS